MGPDRSPGILLDARFRLPEVSYDVADRAVFYLVGAVRRHGGRGPGLGQGRLEVGHGLCGIAVEHVANREREHEPVVVAASERRIEEEVTGFLEARHRADLVDAALHVGVAVLPVLDLAAVPPPPPVGHTPADRLTLP